MSKPDFLARVLRARLVRQDKACPYCGTPATTLLARKHFLLHLRKCPDCGLLFRWPKDTADVNAAFYQRAYVESGLTTDLPDGAQLAHLLESNFAGTEKDFSTWIAILKLLLPQGRVLDFGSSWGYGTLQLRRAGYDVTGFEVSRGRAQFGRDHLHVPIVDSATALDGLKGEFDAIFSSHVLEHLPDLRQVFRRFHALLKPGGHLLVFVPNCGGEKARQLGVRWGPMLGEKHPLSLDRGFLETALTREGFSAKFFSDPYALDEIAASLAGQREPAPAAGDELMVAATRRVS